MRRCLNVNPPVKETATLGRDAEILMTGLKDYSHIDSILLIRRALDLFSLGEQAKKIPTDNSWDFNIWWWGGIRCQTALKVRETGVLASFALLRLPAQLDEPISQDFRCFSPRPGTGDGTSTLRTTRAVQFPLCGIEPASASSAGQVRSSPKWRREPHRSTPAPTTGPLPLVLSFAVNVTLNRRTDCGE